MKKLIIVILIMCAFCNFVLGDEIYSNEQLIIQYIEAANNGDSKAQHLLGLCYLQGIGVEKNISKGFGLIKSAAWKGEMVYEDVKKSVELVQKSAYLGDAEAQYILALYYTYGFGVWPDESIKNELLSMSDSYGMIFLHSVPDIKTPIELLRKSASQGHAAAQYELGICYFNGQVVGKNIEESIEWFKKSAEQNYVPAEIILEHYHLNNSNKTHSTTNETQQIKTKSEIKLISSIFNLDEPETLTPFDSNTKHRKSWWWLVFPAIALVWLCFRYVCKHYTRC